MHMCNGIRSHLDKNTRNSSGDEIAERDTLLPLLRLTPPTEGIPWDDLHKILHRGQTMARVQNNEEILPKFQPPIRAHKRYSRQTDLR